MSKFKSLKDKASVVVLAGTHFFTKLIQKIEKIPKQIEKEDVEKLFVGVNTDKHPRALIVTPDVVIDIRAGGRGKKRVVHLSIMPQLLDEKAGRHNIKLTQFDDMRDMDVRISGERIMDNWKRWTEED